MVSHDVMQSHIVVVVGVAMVVIMLGSKSECRPSDPKYLTYRGIRGGDPQNACRRSKPRNCRPRQVNPYERGCTTIYHCRRPPTVPGNDDQEIVVTDPKYPFPPQPPSHDRDHDDDDDDRDHDDDDDDDDHDHALLRNDAGLKEAKHVRRHRRRNKYRGVERDEDGDHDDEDKQRSKGGDHDDKKEDKHVGKHRKSHKRGVGRDDDGRKGSRVIHGRKFFGAHRMRKKPVGRR